MPSSNKARKVILELTDGTGVGPIFELGSGWGNLLIPLAKKYPSRKVVGYEMSLFPWLVTRILKVFFNLQNLHVHRKDFMNTDLSSASVIVCYLFTDGMVALESKLLGANKSLEYLISNNFSLPSYHPAKTMHLNDLYKSPIYLYRFNPSI